MLDAQRKWFIQTWHAKKKKHNTLCDQVCYAVLIKVVEKGKTGKQSRNSKYKGSTPAYHAKFSRTLLGDNNPEAFSITIVREKTGN